MKPLRWMVAAILISAAQAGSAATSVTQWGVAAVTSSGDCSLLFECDAVGLLAGIWTPIKHTESGGLNQTFASQIDVPQAHVTAFAGLVDMGITSAQVQLDNANLSVPLLKAKAESYDYNGWVSGFAFGIQGYQYTGVAATTLTLAAALSGTVVNPTASDVTGFSIGVWFLEPDPAIAFPSTPPATLGELTLSVLSSTTPADEWLADFTASGPVSASNPLAITVAPGDEFYLMAGLVASATGPGHSADAFGTLTLSFQDPSNLVPVGVVPEPRAYVLLLVALGLVVCAVRRRQRIPG